MLSQCNCQDCFQKNVKNCPNCQNCQKMSTSKIVKMVKYCQNCQQLSTIVKMLVRSCFLITVIKCFKGHRSLGSLFNVKKTNRGSVTEWVSQWQGHLLSCQVTDKKGYCAVQCTLLYNFNHTIQRYTAQQSGTYMSSEKKGGIFTLQGWLFWKVLVFWANLPNLWLYGYSSSIPTLEIMKCQMSWYVKCHEMSNVIKCQMSWNVKCHKMSNVIKFQMSWNVKCREMSNVMLCQMSWNIKCHEMSWNFKCHEMSKVMKC